MKNITKIAILTLIGALIPSSIVFAHGSEGHHGGYSNPTPQYNYCQPQQQTYNNTYDYPYQQPQTYVQPQVDSTYVAPAQNTAQQSVPQQQVTTPKTTYKKSTTRNYTTHNSYCGQSRCSITSVHTHLSRHSTRSTNYSRYHH